MLKNQLKLLKKKPLPPMTSPKKNNPLIKIKYQKMSLRMFLTKKKNQQLKL
jgi:hypothetical protein